eukprot:375281-Rhodomonas_salina.1
MHADALDALYAHTTLDATPLPPLLMPADALDALNASANDVSDVMPLPPLLAPPPVPLPSQ